MSHRCMSHRDRARARIMRAAASIYLEALSDPHKLFRLPMWEAYEALCAVLDVSPNDLSSWILKNKEDFDGNDCRNVG